MVAVEPATRIELADLLRDTRNPYEVAAETLLRETGCTVRKWRKNNTGTAYTSSDDWGIESPRPRGPISFGTFAHEVGHQELHRHNSAPRWLEEIEAWEYSLAQFDRFGLEGQEKARADAVKCIVWACVKASKRCSPESAHKILMRVPDWVGEVSGATLWAELLARSEAQA